MATNTVFNPYLFSEMTRDTTQLAAHGIIGSCAANATSNTDMPLTGDVIILGGNLVIGKGTWGDYLDAQIIDIDNVLGFGANTVINQFVTSAYILSGSSLQINALYPVKILAGLYLRLIYHNTSMTDTANFSMNYNLHAIKS